MKKPQNVLDAEALKKLMAYAEKLHGMATAVSVRIGKAQGCYLGPFYHVQVRRATRQIKGLLMETVREAEGETLSAAINKALRAKWETVA